MGKDWTKLQQMNAFALGQLWPDGRECLLDRADWTKLQQTNAFALRQLWPDGCACLLDRALVIQADTLKLIQGGFTWMQHT